MYKPNIISAGKMMAIVVMLFGVLHFAASYAPVQEGLGTLAPGTFKAVPFYTYLAGALLVFLGGVLLVLFVQAGGKRSLETPILVVGTLIAVCGILSVAFVYRNPFSWMTAILGLAVFIDSLCLKLVDSKKYKKAAR